MSRILRMISDNSHAMSRSQWIIGTLLLGLMVSNRGSSATLRTILAGGETALPADTPSGRLDAGGLFPFVGALEISAASGSYKGSAVAISRDWMLTAGHNADLNDHGLPDTGWNATLHLPGIGAFGIAEAFTLLSFSGFANPSVHDDLALLRLSAPLPLGMGFPTFMLLMGALLLVWRRRVTRLPARPGLCETMPLALEKTVLTKTGNSMILLP